MMRQCAWCLRLIDGAGERVSPAPLPKLYEASHGICSVCGTLWIEQALATDVPTYPTRQHLPHQPQMRSPRTTPPEAVPGKENVSASPPVEQPAASESITGLVLELQRRKPRRSSTPQTRRNQTRTT